MQIVLFDDALESNVQIGKAITQKHTRSLSTFSYRISHKRMSRASYKLTPYEYLMSSMFDKLFVVLNLCMASRLES